MGKEISLAGEGTMAKWRESAHSPANKRPWGVEMWNFRTDIGAKGALGQSGLTGAEEWADTGSGCAPVHLHQRAVH
jgi:hypothetical protein